MKKRFVFTFIFIFMFIGTANVQAVDTLTVTQADLNEARSNLGVTTSKGIKCEHDVDYEWYYFYFPHNINIVFDSNLSLPSKTEMIFGNNDITIAEGITVNAFFKNEHDTDVTIRGFGKVSLAPSFYYGDIDIYDSVTFEKGIIFQYCNVTIYGGEFNDNVSIGYYSRALIKNGTFNSTYYEALNVNIFSSVEIEDGVFTGGTEGLVVYDSSSVYISGGTFTGGTSGLLVRGGNDEISASNAEIRGGTFISTGEEDYNGVVGAVGIGDDLTFEGLLYDGYMYSPSSDYSSANSRKYMNAREVSVVVYIEPEPVEPDAVEPETEPIQEEPIENPKTYDNITNYISMLLISIVGIVSLGVYKYNI